MISQGVEKLDTLCIQNNAELEIGCYRMKLKFHLISMNILRFFLLLLYFKQCYWVLLKNLLKYIYLVAVLKVVNCSYVRTVIRLIFDGNFYYVHPGFSMKKNVRCNALYHSLIFFKRLSNIAVDITKNRATPSVWRTMYIQYF